MIVVIGNGSCHKAAAFERFIASRPELMHVRTRNKSPHTDGVVECCNRVLKYEDRFRRPPGRRPRPHAARRRHRDLHNQIRPHKHLAWARPLEALFAEPITNVNALG